MSGWNLSALIDHTVLRPDATKVEVLRLCEEAKANGFTVIFVPPCYIDEAVAAVAGTSIRVGIPIGFPLGGHSTQTKVAEAVDAVAHGAQVLDMVLNVSRLKSGDHDYVRNDIAEVVQGDPGCRAQSDSRDVLSDAAGETDGVPFSRRSRSGLCEDLDRIWGRRRNGRGCPTLEGDCRGTGEGEGVGRHSRLEDHAGDAGGRSR